MIQKNPYAAYNNSKIQTATPAELTLLLYEVLAYLGCWVWLTLAIRN